MAWVKQVLTSIVSLIIFVFMGLLGVGLIIGGVSVLFGKAANPQNMQLEYVVGTLSQNPQITIYSNGEAREVRLVLKEYPDHDFVINGDALEATRHKMMNTYLLRGDSVFLQVSAGAFDESADEDEPQVHIRPIAVYSARSSNQIYLTVENYCKKANANDPFLGVILLVFGSLFVSPIFLFLIKGKSLTN